MSNYQKRVLSELFACFGYESFVAWELADLIESPYGNACSTLRGLVKTGNLVVVAPDRYSIKES